MYKKVKTLLFSVALLLCCITASAVGTQPSAGDGSQANPYQIATSDNLVWFAGHVNSGNASACAILTTDIVVNSGVLNADGTLNGTPQNIWTPIGGFNGGGNDYSGEFNGNGHTISGLYFNDGSKNNVGLFGKATDGANIHDVGVSDSYFYGKDHVGGICGDFANGRIENCWNGATVYAKDWNAGGISGSCWIYASISDCYNIGKIIPCDGSNPSYGGICGAVYENTGIDYTISNCHTLEGKCDKGVYGSLDGGCPASKINNSFVKDAAAFASGEVCYTLNRGVTGGSQKWFQTLGTDNFPVLDNSHSTVYYGYDGDVLKYSNSPLTPPTIDNVAYIDANGEQQTADNVSIINNASEPVTWSAGWYVVQGADITLAKGAVCNGAVHLILADGAKLTATGVENHPTYTPGIKVSGGSNSLTIYGQSAQSGQLIANGAEYAAGIGGERGGNGSNITINGGDVTATGGKNAAGIGGGCSTGSSGGNGTNITINGGTVTANGGLSGAGIGGGMNGNGSDIIINGGTVTANGGSGGAGIGAGNQGSCSNINITGGKVTANGGPSVAGIGVGNGGLVGVSVSCSNINITGGEVSANGGIGGGTEASVSNITIAATLLVKADNNNPPATVIPNSNTGADLASSLAGKKYVTTEPIIITYGEYITVSPEFESGANVAYGTEVTFTAADRWNDYYEFLGLYKDSTFNIPITEGVNDKVYTLTVADSPISVYAKYETFTPVFYIDVDGQEKHANATDITNQTSTLNAGWYVVSGTDVQTGTLICNGAVHLILADDAILTAKGVCVPKLNPNAPTTTNSLIIYGQTNQSGQLIAKGEGDAAGIGGKNPICPNGSNITINGGIVTATGGDNLGFSGAGIGGASGGSGSNITINGGIVTAIGGNKGAGIGGGTVFTEESGDGSNITINGGKVTATGGYGGAGIGGGAPSGSVNPIDGNINTPFTYRGDGSNITINGGMVTANGGDGGAAGIGGGWEGSSSDIKVAIELNVRADNNNPPITVIDNNGSDIAESLSGKRYAVIEHSPKGNLTINDFVVEIPGDNIYTGLVQEAVVSFTSGITGAGEITVTYKQGDEEVAPINVGNYDIYATVTEGTGYNAFPETKIGTLTINKATPSIADFDLFTPANLVWDGNPKTVTVVFNDQDGKLTGVGDITVKYNGNTQAPIAAGTYTVTIDVAEGDNYASATALTDDSWRFTIMASSPISVSYIDENGETKTTNALEVKTSDTRVMWGTAGQTTWYVVTDENVVLNKSALCDGDVRLILADGAKLTATGDDDNQTPGIYVSGNGSSLTIYGQAAQSGQLIAQGGNHAAGIGGASGGNGSNITINGGKITATGGQNASGIGGGENGSASNIFVAAALTVRADNSNPPTTVIDNNGSDIAESLSGKRYAVIEHSPKGNLTINDFVVEIPGDNIYTGLVQEAVVSFTSGITGAGEITVTYKQGDEEVAPINVGNYDIYATVTEGTDYYAFPETKIGRRSIWQASYTFSDFTFFLPENLEYDGTPKVATFVYDDKDGQRTGYGDITVKYNDNTQAPIEPGDYVVSIDISEGLNYIQLEHMTCDEWTFTITIDLDEYKAEVIAEIEAAGQGIQNEFVNNWINAAIHDINQQGTDTKAKVDYIKLKILDLIYAFQDGKAEGYAEGLEEGKAVGRAEAFGEMGTPCDDCPAVEVSKGTTTIRLYNPDKVEFKK